MVCERFNYAWSLFHLFWYDIKGQEKIKELCRNKYMFDRNLKYSEAVL